MEPPVFRSALSESLNSEGGASDAPDFKIKTLTDLELRGWGPGLMGRL